MACSESSDVPSPTHCSFHLQRRESERVEGVNEPGVKVNEPEVKVHEPGVKANETDELPILLLTVTLRLTPCPATAHTSGEPTTNWGDPHTAEHPGSVWIPPTNIILAGHWSRGGWKRTVRRLLLAEQYADFITDCSHLPLSECTELKLGRITPHHSVCRGFLRATKLNITQIRLLVNCHGLETDTCRFRNNVSRPNMQAMRIWTRRHYSLYISLPCPLLCPYSLASAGGLRLGTVIRLGPERFCGAHPGNSLDRGSATSERDH